MYRFLGLFFLIILLQSCNQTESNKQNLKEKKEYVTDVNPQSTSIESGKIIYIKNCKVCHQINGRGVPKIYPPIVNTKRAKGNPDYLIDILLKGMSGEVTIEGEKYNNVMASYKQLSDKDIADVINYIRNKTNPELEIVTSQDVKSRR